MENQNIVTLIDEEGAELRFEVLDVIDYEGAEYAVLLPDDEEADSVIILKVNVDEEGELAVRFGVMSIPMLVVIKNGEVVNSSVGFMSKSEVLELLK